MTKSFVQCVCIFFFQSPWHSVTVYVFVVHFLMLVAYAVEIYLFIYLFSMCLCFPGSEPLHVHTSDLHTAPFANHACPSPHNTSVPSSSQQHSRLRTPPWSALHCWHWRYPGVHGRAHCWHQTPRSPHGPQPTGQPIRKSWAQAYL